MKPKFKLITTGNSTCMELCGKTIRKGITSVTFTHSAEDKKAKLSLGIDLSEFDYGEDGKYKEAEAQLDKQVAAEQSGHKEG